MERSGATRFRRLGCGLRACIGALVRLVVLLRALHSTGHSLGPVIDGAVSGAEVGAPKALTKMAGSGLTEDKSKAPQFASHSYEETMYLARLMAHRLILL